jgi:hypothetical protein
LKVCSYATDFPPSHAVVLFRYSTLPTNEVVHSGTPLKCMAIPKIFSENGA